MGASLLEPYPHESVIGRGRPFVMVPQNGTDVYLLGSNVSKISRGFAMCLVSKILWRFVSDCEKYSAALCRGVSALWEQRCARNLNVPSESTRVEVLSKNNVRLAVNSGEKETFFTAKRPHILALNAVRAVNFCEICVGFSSEKFSFTAFTGFLTKKKLPYRGSNHSPTSYHQLLIPLRHLSLTSEIFPVKLR